MRASENDEGKKSRKTWKTRKRNAGIIRIQSVREFYAASSSSVRHSPRKFPANGTKGNVDRWQRQERERRAIRSGKNGIGMKGKKNRGARKESDWENSPYNWSSSWKLSKTKAAREKIAECEILGKVEISFANQNSCRQVRKRTGRREEFDEAFSRYLSLPVNANENRLPFIAFTLHISRLSRTNLSG